MNNPKPPLRGHEIDMHDIVQQVRGNGLDGIDKVMNEKVRNNVFFNSAKEFRKKLPISLTIHGTT